MNTRLALIREKLGMTTRKFGEHLNITGGAITNMEKGTRGITERTISDICRTFNINETWFRTGEGEMFVENDSTILEELSNQYNLDSLDRKIIESYLKLSTEDRSAIKKYINSIVDATKISEDLSSSETNIDRQVENYRQELEAEQKGETLLVTLEQNKNLG